jgi:hypothetical protein
VSLFPANESVRAMCIFFPHRHAGNSAQPGTNSRSKLDMRLPHWDGKSARTYHAGGHLTDSSTAERVIDKEYSPSKARASCRARYSCSRAIKITFDHQ